MRAANFAAARASDAAPCVSLPPSGLVRAVAGELRPVPSRSHLIERDDHWQVPRRFVGADALRHRLHLEARSFRSRRRAAQRVAGRNAEHEHGDADRAKGLAGDHRTLPLLFLRGKYLTALKAGFRCKLRSRKSATLVNKALPRPSAGPNVKHFLALWN